MIYDMFAAIGLEKFVIAREDLQIVDGFTMFYAQAVADASGGGVRQIRKVVEEADGGECCEQDAVVA